MKKFLVLIALLCAVVQGALAHGLDDQVYYSVSQDRSDIIRISAPVYDKAGIDGWITDGKLNVSVNGGEATTILSWHSNSTDINDNATSVSCYFGTTAALAT